VRSVKKYEKIFASKVRSVKKYEKIFASKVRSVKKMMQKSIKISNFHLNSILTFPKIHNSMAVSRFIHNE